MNCSAVLGRLLAALVIVLPCGAGRAAEPQAPPAQPEVPASAEGSVRPGGADYQIGRQDLLEIRVFGLDELTQTVRVSEDGSIKLPLLGRIDAAGLSKSGLEEVVAKRLEEHVRDPQVTIFVREYESKKVAVSGAVKRPGTYEMLGTKTLLELISMAGGLDQDYGDEIVIFRQNGGGTTDRISVNLEGLVYDADPALNMALAPSDIIYVPVLKKIRIFVGGAVRLPSQYEVPRDKPVTVLRAITLAGGTTDRAAEKKVQVIRSHPNGTRTSFVINLKKVRRGEAEDPVLKPDDVVLVPDAVF
jgi:polysaccharide export outer membrane protein